MSERTIWAGTAHRMPAWCLRSQEWYCTVRRNPPFPPLSYHFWGCDTDPFCVLSHVHAAEVNWMYAEWQSGWIFSWRGVA